MLGMIPLMTLLATAIAGCGHQEEPSADQGVPKVVKANLYMVGKTASFDSYEATGTIKSMLNASLSSKVMGRVVDVSARDGDTIKKGELLVSLDPRELQAAVDISTANYHSSVVGVANASTAAVMEEETSKAKIAQAESQVKQAQAGLAEAEAKRDLVLAGPRTQEVAESHLAVVQAESNLKLAKRELERTTNLVQEGALAKRE